jgi:hypothetical protein
MAQSASQLVTGWAVRFRSLAGQDFSHLHNVEIGSGDHTASYPKVSGDLSPGVKRPEH